MSKTFESTRKYENDSADYNGSMEWAIQTAVDDVMRPFWRWLMAQRVYPVPVTGSMKYGHDEVTAVLIVDREET